MLDPHIIEEGKTPVGQLFGPLSPKVPTSDERKFFMYLLVRYCLQCVWKCVRFAPQKEVRERKIAYLLNLLKE